LTSRNPQAPGVRVNPPTERGEGQSPHHQPHVRKSPKMSEVEKFTFAQALAGEADINFASVVVGQ
jgi:hypothetical protein